MNSSSNRLGGSTKSTVLRWSALSIALVISACCLKLMFVSHPDDQRGLSLLPSILSEISYEIKPGETSPILALADIVSRDRIPVEIRYNLPDSLTEFGEWKKINGPIQFPHQVSFVQYRAIDQVFRVKVRGAATIPDKIYEVRYKIVPGEISKSFWCDSIISWTNEPVYLRFNGKGEWHYWETPTKKVPADTNTIELKADKAEIIVVVQESGLAPR